MAPEGEILTHALRVARSLRGAWAARFTISISDPRWLEATEETILGDLVIAHESHRQQRSKNAPLEQVEQHLEHYQNSVATLREAIETGKIRLMPTSKTPEAPKTVAIRTITTPSPRAP